MKRRTFLHRLGYTGIGLSLFPSPKKSLHKSKEVSVGMIGLDTSHATAFTKILNDPQADTDVSGFRVSHAYPHGSHSIESSYSRIPRYTQEMKEMGVVITDSIEALLDKVDVVLLETNDGRLHLEQAKMVFEAGKPTFIDKPIAASLSDAIQIFDLAQQHGVPVFSASSLRFGPSTVAVANNQIGKIIGATTYSPAKLEPSHPDLFWYGIHGVESLFTVMGTGCEQVRRIYTAGTDTVIGEWKDGRIGTFRGLRDGKQSYGGTAFGTKGITEVGAYEGYRPLVVEIASFFRGGPPPVSPEETLEIFAFMAAAEESKHRNGAPVRLETVMQAARK